MTDDTTTPTDTETPGPGDGQILPSPGDGVVVGDPGPLEPGENGVEPTDVIDGRVPDFVSGVPPAPPIEALPKHLVELRNKAAERKREYDDAAEHAKSAKKGWEAARETFEGAFDAEVRRQRDGQTPGLPFDGVHMAETLPQTGEPEPEKKGPAEVHEFPRAVEDPAPEAEPDDEPESEPEPDGDAD